MCRCATKKSNTCRAGWRLDAIKKYDMDLVVCGHHQDFWSKLMSSARQLINTVHVDMLIVPLRDEEE